VERSVRLPHSWWLYEAPADAHEVQPRPADAPVVFGCLNTVAKLSPAALALWAEILHRVPGSRLLLHCPEGSTRERLLGELGAKGITRDRVQFAPFLSMAQFFAQHHQIDIALDPFPYGGGTTTCDALWMGVPVVTLQGDLAVSRGSASILATIGLPELIAADPAAYIDIALRLAGDPSHRAALRGNLRAQMRRSPLMDAPGFINGLETAYRTMWSHWCASQRP
jgi:predicted O-linked N-acetylglucosamine transferase (SPINDLY family)